MKTQIFTFKYWSAEHKMITIIENYFIYKVLDVVEQRLKEW